MVLKRGSLFLRSLRSLLLFSCAFSLIYHLPWEARVGREVGPLRGFISEDMVDVVLGVGWASVEILDNRVGSGVRETMYFGIFKNSFFFDS